MLWEELAFKKETVASDAASLFSNSRKTACARRALAVVG
jgi:hypothetical protein